MMKVLVTGGNGFVGSWIVEALSALPDVEVACLARRKSNLRWIAHLPVNLVYGDVTDPKSLPAAVRGRDLIIHTAGLVKARSRREFFRVNAGGTRNLVAAALKHGRDLRRFVLVSSQAAAGPAPGPFPLTEQSPSRPLNTYGASKRRAEQWLMKTPARFSWSIVRPCAVYGPRDAEILTFVKLAARHRIFPVPGPQPPTVAMIHARDLAAAVLAAAESPAAHRRLYFATDGVHYHWQTMRQELERTLGVSCRQIKIPAWAVKMAGLASEIGAFFTLQTPMFTREKALELTSPYWMCSSDRLQHDTGWRPRISLPEGLDETVAWYRKQKWI